MQRQTHIEPPEPVIELPAALRRKRALARAVLIWEKLWPALWPPLGVIGLFALSAMAGLWRDLPFYVHIGALALFAVLLILAVLPLRRLQWPRKSEALRRLELASGLEHRPLSSLFDTLSLGLDDASTRRLWQAHKQALKTSARQLKTGWPAPGLARRDPYALRALLLLLLIPAYLYAGPEWNRSLMQALNPAHGYEPQIITMDAWLKPPAYTAAPALFLAQGQIAQDRPAEGKFSAPVGSELVIRLSGTGQAPRLILDGKSGKSSFIRKADRVWEARRNLAQSGPVGVWASGRGIASWQFELLPDAPPQIRLVKRPETTPSQVLKLTYEMSDDYGVKQAAAKFRLKTSSQSRDTSPPLVKPPGFSLPVFSGQGAAKPQVIYRDLTAHPWAGLEVELTLSARDGAGQETASQPVYFRLPERVFTKALAKAIIEQRRLLALDPENRWIAGTALDALSMAPERFIKNSGIYLGLRTAYRALHQIDDEIDLSGVMSLLWDIALDVEGGDLTAAARNLRQAQEKLRRALEQGASDDQIAKLMQQLKNALGQYLEEMRKRAAAAKPGSPRQRLLNNRVIRPQDLTKMLDELENLARSGARDAARQMLSKLQDLLENLTAAPGPHEDREDQAMNKWMEDFDKLMREQQKLQEETFSKRKPETGNRSENSRAPERSGKKPPGGEKGEKQGRMKAGKDGQQGKPARRQRELQGRQKALRRTLQGLSRQLGKMGLKAPDPFGRAGEAMERAGKQLGKGRNGDAAGEQGKALDNLRRAMRSIARQIMRRMARNAGGGPQGKNRVDPLGRTLPSDQLGSNERMRRSGNAGMKEAFRLRNELKRRLGERSRPEPERQYLERLLRWF